MVSTFSVSEIAKKIKRPGEDDRIACDRIRNWTREGLMTPVGEKNPGTGRSRIYAREALVDAVLLQVFTECTGIPAVKMGPILEEAKKAIGQHASCDSIVLVMSRSVGDQGWKIKTIYRTALPKFLAKANADTHTYVDLKRLFVRARLSED